MYRRGFLLNGIKISSYIFNLSVIILSQFHFICKQWLYSNAYAYLTKLWTFSNKTQKRKERQTNFCTLKYFCINFHKYLCTKETDILVRERCRKNWKILYKRKMAMCNNSMEFPFCYSLHNSEYFVHLLLRPPMNGLIRSLELVGEGIVLKAIRRDIAIHFNSLTFAWTALRVFSPLGNPFLPKSTFRVFNFPGV